MTEATRVERLSAELDDGSTAGLFGDALAVWAGLADAFWLSTLRAVLAPEPPASLRRPALLVGPGAPDRHRDDARRSRAA